MFSCAVQYDSPRVEKNKVIVHTGKVSENDLKPLIRQKPNKKILLVVPFHLAVHNMASHLKDRSAKKHERIDRKIEKRREKGKPVDMVKFEKKKNRTLRSWLMETVGEAPVLLDSSRTKQSIRQMELFLRKRGHFYAQVTDTVIPSTDKKTVTVQYHVFGGTPYVINDFNWHTDDEQISRRMSQIMQNTLIQSGQYYNEDLMDDERDRITAYLRNRGFFHFSKSFIHFTADTGVGNNQIVVGLQIRNFMEKSSEDQNKLVQGRHPISKVGNIYFNLDFMHDGSNRNKLDTIPVEFLKNKKDTTPKIYYFVYENQLSVKPKTLLRKCFVKTGDLLSIDNVTRTNNAFSSLGVFRYINIRFVENGKDSLGYHLMDMHVDLSKTQKQTTTIELEGTNSAGNLGLSANISYRNRNTFKGAEALSFKVRGAIEAQTLASSEIEDDNIIDVLPFNTIETGFETEMTFPTFLMPFTGSLFTERNMPKTAVSTGLFFQQRPDYTRYIANLSMTYSWRETSTKQHQWSPAFANIVRIFPDSVFTARIEQFSRPLQTSYKDHFISGTRHTYTFSNQGITNKRRYTFFRSNLEVAGTLSGLFSRFVAGAQAGQTYYILGIRFAQYTKGDMDYRTFFNVSDKSTLALRLFTGVGVPYGNTDVLPFDKRYSAGGANDIRAWKFRSLGPGTYSDELRFDKTGDMSIVANIEYRFPIYKLIQSALFVDAGNVWMLRKYEDYPGGEIRLNDFAQTIAIGTGVGLRLNFGFFIFRIDAAIPIHDPAQANENKWLKLSDSFKRTNLNFGIGYPF
jgi:outer membrane protein assembly factor BamA